MSDGISRRRFLRYAGAAAVAAADVAASGGKGASGMEVEEATIEELRRSLDSGERTCRSLVVEYLARIESLDRGGPGVNSVLAVNPDAVAIAEDLDRERRERGPRGPLHGIPVLVKDNLDTGDRMATTAGSLALAGAPAGRDAFVVARLRTAGCVLLGKTNLSEWANFRSRRSSSGWSAVGGQTRNPYALDRNPCGSSSGSGAAVAASLCAAAIGTETDGSIVCPANANGVVGIKPTLGLVSRAGIVPIAHSQDTAGPMARTVADAVALLQAITGPDPRDPSTTVGAPPAGLDLGSHLRADGLRGLRLGVARNYTGFHEGCEALLEDAIAALQAGGAVVVDGVELAHKGEYDDAEYQVLLYEFKADLATYLASRAGLPVGSLADLIAFNEAHAEREMPYFRQEIFAQAQEKGGLDEPAYREALALCRRLAGAEGIDAALGARQLDALVAITGGPAWATDLVTGDHGLGSCSTPAAVAGYPHVSVPMGFVWGLPVNLSLFGAAFSEPLLIGAAYAFEQATRHRRAPRYLTTAALGNEERRG